MEAMPLYSIVHETLPAAIKEQEMNILPQEKKTWGERFLITFGLLGTDFVPYGIGYISGEP
ncbi:hypothetical protein [Paenibacillus sp. GYB003]|uniref:hypothetical protein n=1 Tax=Paenibacillus sp. GYB003 TaxID=2994392 RepID=UPI002F9622FF